jgi:hypothetical protein
MQIDWSTGGRTGRVYDLSTVNAPSRFVTAVSLHAHTHYSSEAMVCIPRYLDRIPVVASLFHLEMRRYRERNGKAADFSKGWWHPPATPETVLLSEARQITDALGLRPLVSITDHDSIAAPLALRPERPDTPISFEWTVPYEEGFFHVGVHNLDPTTARDRFVRLLAHTQAPDTTRAADLFDEINADPATLVVLNHPLWDLAGVGQARHKTLLRRFLIEHGAWIHALEVNGYRLWRENAAVGALAKNLSLPLISGGDRHGYTPNSLLNLTSAATFADFASEIRVDRASDVAVMPQYRDPLVRRKLAVAADVMRENPDNPPGRQHWFDRISYQDGNSVVALSAQWPTGGPLWVRTSIGAFQFLASPPLLSALAYVTVKLSATAAQSGVDADVPDAAAGAA